MGEYAKSLVPKNYGESIKIGTCEMMYYLRFSDRNKVKPESNSIQNLDQDGLFWRVPFPDEDKLAPGCYDQYNRGERLDNGFELGLDDTDKAGNMQFHNESGLLLNVSCWHGERLPEKSKDFRACWNGKSWFYELAHLKKHEGVLVPVVHCRFCRNMWRVDWSDIWDYLLDEKLKDRLYSLALEDGGIKPA